MAAFVVSMDKMRLGAAVVAVFVLAFAGASASAGDGKATRANGRIVFGLRQVDQWRIVGADLRSRRSLVVKNTEDADSPSLSPDGRFLAYVRGAEFHPAIWVSRADGTHGKRLEGGCQPTWAPSGGRLAFMLDLDQAGYCTSHQLAVVNRDGSGFATIYDGSIGYPKWSPDGQWIAFVAFRGPPGDDLCIIRPDGSDLRVIAGDVQAYGYSWSPDGRQVVFEKQTSKGTGFELNLFTATVAGGALTQLTSSSSSKYDPTWSRDGRYVAFSSSTRGASGTGVAILDRQTGSEQVVGQGSAPAWSRDGRLAFLGASNAGIMVVRPGSAAHVALRLGMAYDVRDLSWRPSGRGFVFRELVADGRSHLFGVGQEGTGLRRLKALRTAAVEPAWSPNGRLLAFTRVRAQGSREIAVSRADGSHLRMLTHDPYGWDAQPTWSPDGKRVAFVRSTSWASYYEGRSLYVARLAGGKARPLSSVKRPDHPAWSPDGQSIAVDGDRRSPMPGIRLIHLRDGQLEAVTHPSGDAVDRAATWSPSGAQLAFVRTYPGEFPYHETWVLTVATGAVQALSYRRYTDPEADSLSWAPDGTAIAVAGSTGNTGAPAVLTIRPDGLGQPIVLWENPVPVLRHTARFPTGVAWRPR